MRMIEWVMKCRLCGTIYMTYAHMVGDLTVCGDCRINAKKRGCGCGYR